MLRNTDESWTSRGKKASQEQVHYIQVHRVRYTRTEGQLTNLQGEITFTDTRGLIHQSIISLRADGLTSGWRISFPLSTSSSPEWHIISSDRSDIHFLSLRKRYWIVLGKLALSFYGTKSSGKSSSYYCTLISQSHLIMRHRKLKSLESKKLMPKISSNKELWALYKVWLV